VAVDDDARTEPGASEHDVTDAPQPTAGELLIGLLDGTLSAWARRPLRVRVRTSPAGALRGRMDVVVIEVRELRAAGLQVDRFLVHAEQLRIEPGLPPRLKAGPVGFKATVTQPAVDAWTRASRLPVRLLLTPEGIVARTKVAGISVGEVTTELSVSGPLLQLRPVRASMLGLPAPLLGVLRGFLPLPPLPMGARLVRVESGDGTLTTWFDVGDVDEPLTPDAVLRIRRRLRPRLPR
jgi:hypothetical protein